MDLNLSEPDRQRIADCLQNQGFREAVKLCCSLTGCGLHAARLQVEAIRARLLDLTPCPQCDRQQLVGGWLGVPGKPALFRPAALRSFSVTSEAAVRLATAEAMACLDCGLVWGDLLPAHLSEFIQKHCRESNSVELNQCLKCHSNRLARGRIITDHRPALLPAVFAPSGRQAFTFTLGGPRLAGEAIACLDCGFVWTSTSQAKLQSFIQKYCDLTPGNAAAFPSSRPRC